jgi:Protein of unknown function (DUF2889)
MPLPVDTAARERIHRRTISIEGFRRGDGLYDLEAQLVDAKDFPFQLASGLREAGAPVHDMKVRMTFDRTLTIVDLRTVTDGMPYPGACDRINHAYAALKGVRMQPGFTLRLRELFGGLAGCTHITELIGNMATVAYQTLAGEIKQDPDRKPFQLDGCHALDTTGPTVARYYPRWARAVAEK